MRWLVAAILLGAWQCAAGENDTCPYIEQAPLWLLEDESNSTNLHQFVHLGCYSWTAPALERYLIDGWSSRSRVDNPHECATQCIDDEIFMLVAGVCVCVKQKSLAGSGLSTLQRSDAATFCTETCVWDASQFPSITAGWNQTGFCGGGGANFTHLSLYQRYNARYLLPQDMADGVENIRWQVVQVQTDFGNRDDRICVEATCILESKLDYFGNDLSSGTPLEVNSWMTCSSKCEQHDDCRYWTYDAGTCHLKDNDSDKRSHETAISGSRACARTAGLGCQAPVRTRDYFLLMHSLDIDATAFPMQVRLESPSAYLQQQEQQILPLRVLTYQPDTIWQMFIPGPVPATYSCTAGYDCVVQLEGYAFSKTNFVKVIRKGDECNPATPTANLGIESESTREVENVIWSEDWARGTYSFGIPRVGIHLTICFGDWPAKQDQLEYAGDLIVRGPFYVVKNFENVTEGIFNMSEAEFDIFEGEYIDNATDFNSTTVTSSCMIGDDHCYIVYLSMDHQTTDHVAVVKDGTCGNITAQAVTYAGIINPSAPSFIDADRHLVVHDLGKIITGQKNTSCTMFGKNGRCPGAISGVDYELCWGGNGLNSDLQTYPVSLGKLTLTGPFLGKEFHCSVKADCVIGPLDGLGINEIGGHIVILQGGHTCGDPSSLIAIINGFTTTAVEKNDVDEYHLGAASDPVLGSRWPVCWTRELRDREDDQNNITQAVYIPDFAVQVGELVFLPAMDQDVVLEVQSTVTFEVPEGAWGEEELHSFFLKYIMQSTDAAANDLQLIGIPLSVQRRLTDAISSDSSLLVSHLNDTFSSHPTGDISGASARTLYDPLFSPRTFPRHPIASTVPTSFAQMQWDTSAHARRLSQSFHFDIMVNNANAYAVNALTTNNYSSLTSSIGDSLGIHSSLINTTTDPVTAQEVRTMVAEVHYAMPPSAVEGEALTTTSIQFSWAFRYDSLGDCDHDEWLVQARRVDSGLWFVPLGCSQLVDPKVTSCLAVDLVSNTAYEFRIMTTCKDWRANSPFSFATAMVSTLPFRADAPGNIVFSNVSLETMSDFSDVGAVDIMWDPGVDIGDCEFTAWEVQARPADILEWNDAVGCEVLPDRDMAACHTFFLHCNTEYEFRVRERCSNVAASSNWTEGASNVTTVLSNKCVTPARAPQMSVFNSTATSPVVSWVPGDASDCAFANWRLQASVAKNADDDDEDDSDDRTTWFSPIGCTKQRLRYRALVNCATKYLRSYRAYKFRIREECVKPMANSLFSPTSTINMPINVASPPTNLFANPTRHTIDLSWRAWNMSDCELARWEVQIWSGEHWWSPAIGCSNWVNAYRPSCTATNLFSQVAYAFRVRAICFIPIATSEWATSPLTSLLLLRAAIPLQLVLGDPEVKLPDEHLATKLVWASGVLGECDFSHWAVERKPASGGWERAIGCTDASMYNYATTTCEAIELVCKVQYEFRVRAECVNAKASSPWRMARAPLHITGASFCISAMRPPVLARSAIFSSITSSSITIVWESSDDDMGDCILFESWIIGICQGDSAKCSAWNLPAECKGISTRHTMRNKCTATGLQSNTPYVIRIAGKCAGVSLSSYFAVSDGLITKRIPSGAPTFLELAQDTPYTLRARWGLSTLSDCTFSSYVVELRREEDDHWITNPRGCVGLDNACITECVLLNLARNTVYAFRVQVLCVESDATNPRSLPATSKTLPLRAQAPVRFMNNPVVTDDADKYSRFSALLSWTARADFDCQFVRWRVSQMKQDDFLYAPNEDSAFLRVRGGKNNNNGDGLCDGNGVNGKAFFAPDRDACEKTCEELHSAAQPCTGISYSPSTQRCVLYQASDTFAIPTSVQKSDATGHPTDEIGNDVRCYARTGCGHLTRRESTSCVATDLRCDSKYLFRVEALCVDALANSLPSSTIIIQTSRIASCAYPVAPPSRLSIHSPTGNGTTMLKFSWYPGSWRDCVFKRWDVEIANAEGGNRTWGVPLGIANAEDFALTRFTCAAVREDPATAFATEIQCLALQLVPDTPYVMRVRTICDEAAAEGRWAMSEVISTHPVKMSLDTNDVDVVFRERYKFDRFDIHLKRGETLAITMESQWLHNGDYALVVRNHCGILSKVHRFPQSGKSVGAVAIPRAVTGENGVTKKNTLNDDDKQTRKTFSWGRLTTEQVEPGSYEIFWCNIQIFNCAILVPPFSQYTNHVANLYVEGPRSNQVFSQALHVELPIVIGPIAYPTVLDVAHRSTIGDRLFVATDLTCQHVPSVVNPTLGPISEGSLDGLRFIWPAGTFIMDTPSTDFALCYVPLKWQLTSGATVSSLLADPTRFAAHIGTLSLITCAFLRETARSTTVGPECKCSKGYVRDHREGGSLECVKCPVGHFCPELVSAYESVGPVKCPLSESTEEFLAYPKVALSNCFCTAGKFRVSASPLTPSSLLNDTSVFGASLDISFFVFPPSATKDIQYIKLLDRKNPTRATQEASFAESNTITIAAALPDSMQQSIEGLEVHIFGLSTWKYMYVQINGIRVGYFTNDDAFTRSTALQTPVLAERILSNPDPGATVVPWMQRPCHPCPSGTLKGNVGDAICAEVCISERPNSNCDSGATSVSDCYCVPLFYWQFMVGACTNCARYNEKHAGVVCPGGFDEKKQHIMPRSEKGFYLVQPNFDEVVMCLAKGGCIGNNRCAEGMVGYACGHCAYGFTRSSITDVCSPCPKDAFRDVLSLCVMTLVYVAVVTAISAMSIRSAKNERGLHAVVLKIMINYLMCIGALSGFSVMHLKWPEWVSTVWGSTDFARKGTPSAVSSFDCILRAILVEYLYWDVNDVKDSSVLMQYAFWIIIPILMLIVQMWSGALILLVMNFRTKKTSTWNTPELSQAQNGDDYDEWNSRTFLRRYHEEYDVSLPTYVKKLGEMEGSSFLPQGDAAIPPLEPTESVLAYVTTHLRHALDMERDVDDLRSVLCAPKEQLVLLDASLLELDVLTESIEMMREACQEYLLCDKNDISARTYATYAIGCVGERITMLRNISERVFRTQVDAILDVPITLVNACTNFGATSVNMLCVIKRQLCLRRKSLAVHQRDEGDAVIDILHGAIYFGDAVVSELCTGAQARDILDHADALRTVWINLMAPQVERAIGEMLAAEAIITRLKDCKEKNVQVELVSELVSMCDTRFDNLLRVAHETMTWKRTLAEPFVKLIMEHVNWGNFYLLEAFVKCVTMDLVPRHVVADSLRGEKELEVWTYLMRTCTRVWRTEMDVDPEVLLEVLLSVPDETLTQLYQKTDSKDVNPATLAARVLEICQVERPKVWALAKIKPCMTRILQGEVDLEALFRAIDYVPENELILHCIAPPKGPDGPVHVVDATWAATVATTVLFAVMKHGGGVSAWGKMLIRPKIWLCCVHVLRVDCDLVLRAVDYMTPEKVYKAVRQVEHILGALEVTEVLIALLKQFSPSTWALAYLQPLASSDGIVVSKGKLDMNILLSNAVPLIPLSALSELVLLGRQNPSHCLHTLLTLTRQHIPNVYAHAVLKHTLEEWCLLLEIHFETLFSSSTLPFAQVLTGARETEGNLEQCGGNISEYDTDRNALELLLDAVHTVDPATYFEALWRIPLRTSFDALELDEEAFYAGARAFPLECLEHLDALVRKNKNTAMHHMLHALRKHCPNEWGWCKLKHALWPMFSKDAIRELDLCGLDKVVEFAMKDDWLGAQEVALKELRKANVALWARIVLEKRCQHFWSIPTVFTPCFMREVSVSHLYHAITMATQSNEWAQAAAFLYQCYQEITCRSNALLTGDFRIGYLEIPRNADMSLMSFLLSTNRLNSDVCGLQWFNSMKRHLQWFTADKCSDVFFQAHSTDAIEDSPYSVSIFTLKAIEKEKYLIAAKKPDGQKGEEYYIGAVVNGRVKMTPHRRDAQVFIIHTAHSWHPPRQFPHCICGRTLTKTWRWRSAHSCMFCTREITVPKKNCFWCVKCNLISCTRCAHKENRRARHDALERAPFEKQDGIVVSINATKDPDGKNNDDDDDEYYSTHNNMARSNSSCEGTHCNIPRHHAHGNRSLHTLVESREPDTRSIGSFRPKVCTDSYLMLEPHCTRVCGLWSYFHAGFPRKQMWVIRHYLQDVKTCFVIFAFFLHPNITNNMLVLIECNTSLSQTRNLGSRAPQARLVSNPDIICWEGDHRLWLVVSFTGLICWTLGVPLLALVWMKKRSRHLLSSMSLREQFGFLYNGFEPRYLFWEIVIMYRKLLVNMVSTVSFGGDDLTRLPKYMLLAALSLAVHLVCAPYDKRGMNLLDRLEGIALWCWLASVAILTGVLMLNFSALTNVIFAFILFGVQLFFFLYILYSLAYENARHARDKFSVTLEDGRGGEGSRGHLRKCHSNNLTTEKQGRHSEEKAAPSSSFAKNSLVFLKKQALRFILYLVPREKEMRLYYRPFPPHKMGIVAMCPEGEINVSPIHQEYLNVIYSSMFATGLSILHLPKGSWRASSSSSSTRSSHDAFETTWVFYDYFVRQIVFLVRNKITQMNMTYHRLGHVHEIVCPQTFLGHRSQNMDMRSLYHPSSKRGVCTYPSSRAEQQQKISPEDVFFVITIDDFYLAYKVVERLIFDMKFGVLQSELATFVVEREKSTQYFLDGLHDENKVQTTKTTSPPPTISSIPTAFGGTRQRISFSRSKQYQLDRHKGDVASLSPVNRFRRVTFTFPEPPTAPSNAEILRPDLVDHASFKVRNNAPIGPFLRNPRLAREGDELELPHALKKQYQVRVAPEMQRADEDSLVLNDSISDTTDRSEGSQVLQFEHPNQNPEASEKLHPRKPRGL